MFSFFFFVCKQNTAYEVRISYWSSDVCSSDLDLSPFRHRVEWHPSLERCEGAQISNGRVCDHAADTIERVDELEPLIDVLSVLLEAGHREHDRGRRRCREIVDLALELRSEEHTSELQSLMRISYAVFCLKKKKIHKRNTKDRSLD